MLFVDDVGLFSFPWTHTIIPLYFINPYPVSKSWWISCICSCYDVNAD